jgi:hypothetical protein
MSKGFYRAVQGKRASGAGPLALHPIPRSGETRYLGKTLTEIGTYNGGRSVRVLPWVTVTGPGYEP